jgi:hypothetical protein
MEADMPTMDVFSITDQLEDAMLDVIVERLETRGAHPRLFVCRRSTT